MNQAKHIAFKVSSCFWTEYSSLTNTHFMSNTSFVKCCFIYINCIAPIYKTGLLRSFSLASIWAFGSLSDWVGAEYEYPISFNFVIIEESDKTISWLLSNSFWMSFELNIPFWHKNYLIVSSIICIEIIFDSRNLHTISSIFPEFYCSDCR